MLKISSACWKILDYFWYIPALGGAILAYYGILDRDLRRELDATLDALDIYVGSAIDFASEERQLICSLAFPGVSSGETNLPSHPMVLPPPDRSILEQEDATVSKELQGQCLEIGDAELMLRHWRNHPNWPGQVPIQDQLDYTWRAAEIGTELGFDQVRGMLETYLRDVKFDRGAGVQFPEFDNIRHYINTWTDLTERLQKGAFWDWAIHKWYWVVWLQQASGSPKSGENSKMRGKSSQKPRHGKLLVL